MRSQVSGRLTGLPELLTDGPALDVAFRPRDAPELMDDSSLGQAESRLDRRDLYRGSACRMGIVDHQDRLLLRQCRPSALQNGKLGASTSISMSVGACSGA